MRKMSKSVWLRRIGPLGLAGALVLPLTVNGNDVSAAKENAKQLYNAKHDAMQGLFDNVEKQRRAAMIDASEGNYDKAINSLEKVLTSIAAVSGDFAVSKRAEINSNILRIKNTWSSEIMQGAYKLARDKKYNEAISKAQQAQKLTPERDYITSFITECQNNRQAVSYRNAVTKAKVLPTYDTDRKDIDLNIREAKLFFRNKRYESARVRLERVLTLDPFNIEAVDMLALIYDKLYNAGLKRSAEMEDFTSARSMWEWADPLPVVQRDLTLEKAGRVGQRSNSELYKRLEEIRFPVPLRNSTVKDVITYLNTFSQRHDPRKEGVTIIDNLPPDAKKRKVSLDLGEMPLLDILRYFSMTSGLSYTFNDNRVVFGNVDNMSTEYFPVHGEIISEIIDSQTTKATTSGMKGVESSGGGDGAPAEGEDTVVSDTVEGGVSAAVGVSSASDSQSDARRVRNALKSYFEKRWITFGPGADISYSPRGERLMVRNTPENLRRMDVLLRQMNALEKPMIMVELKMIELTDTNLNELGFEWMFSASRTKGNGWSLGTKDPTRHGNADGMFRVINDLKIFPNFGEKIFGSDLNVDLSLSVNAVAQNRKAEVLASPRILSENSPKDPAMIKMIEKTYFITEWEEPDVEVDGDTISVDSTDPEWDDAMELGVTFSVVPMVNADNYTITLNNIHPVFLEHRGDYDKYVTYQVGKVTASGEMIPTRLFTYNLRMPEIARREIETNISIYDGETVLIGGMADNEVSSRDDKWPILGDIPLLGRLFRDQQSNVQNRTLLMFITARLVDAKGAPWDPTRGGRRQGLVNFDR